MSTKSIKDQFVESVLESAPVAAMYANIAQVQRAGAEVQRLQEAFTHLIEGGAALATGEHLGELSLSFADYCMRPESGQAPLTRFLTHNMLMDPRVTSEAIQKFADDVTEIATAARAAAQQRTMAVESPHSWEHRIAHELTAETAAAGIRL